ncbi:MAG: sodium:solute symporter [Bacteroidota bacterium]
MTTNGISTIDLLIVVGYFALVLGLGFYFARKNKTSEDLFLGGRTFTWGLVGLSLFASNISSSTIIGLSGKAYSTGVVQSVYEWMSGVPLLIAAVVFIPLYLRSRITTIPEFLELRYDARSRNYFSALTIIMSVVVEMSGGLYAGALVLKTFFPDLVIWQTTLLLAAVAGVYTAAGGLRAVVITDALQAIILIVGCTILTYLLFERVDFDWARVVASVPEGHLSMVRPADDPDLPWTGLLLGVPFLGFWYWSTNQFIVQRVLGSKDIKHARWGVMLAGFLKVVPLFIMVIPGVIAITALTGPIEDPDMVFPTAMKEILPVGLTGLVLAGLISAIMSSVDSTLNSSSTLVVIDFVKPRLPQATDAQIARYGRITTLILTVIAAVWAPQIANFQSLWDYLQLMFSIVVPPIAVIFLLGVFYKRGNRHGAFYTLYVGTAISLVLVLLSQNGYVGTHYTTNVGIMVAISSIIYVVASNMTPAPAPEKIENYTYRPELVSDGMEGLPWYQDYRFHAVLLVLLMAAILIYFW